MNTISSQLVMWPGSQTLLNTPVQKKFKTLLSLVSEANPRLHQAFEFASHIDTNDRDANVFYIEIFRGQTL